MVFNKFTPEMLKTTCEHGSTILSLAIKGRFLYILYHVLKADQRRKNNSA